MSDPKGGGSGPPTRRQLAVFLGYVVAGVLYVAIGLWETDFLLSFWVALAYLLVMVWAVPVVVGRLVGR